MDNLPSAYRRRVLESHCFSFVDLWRGLRVNFSQKHCSLFIPRNAKVLATMHIEYDPTKTDGKIIQILCRSNGPKPVQEIADEIKKSYDDTLQHLEMIGKRRTLRFTPNTNPGGLLDVEIVTGPHNVRFRKPS